MLLLSLTPARCKSMGLQRTGTRSNGASGEALSKTMMTYYLNYSPADATCCMHFLPGKAMLCFHMPRVSLQPMPSRTHQHQVDDDGPAVEQDTWQRASQQILGQIQVHKIGQRCHAGRQCGHQLIGCVPTAISGASGDCKTDTPDTLCNGKQTCPQHQYEPHLT